MKYFKKKLIFFINMYILTFFLNTEPNETICLKKVTLNVQLCLLVCLKGYDTSTVLNKCVSECPKKVLLDTKHYDDDDDDYTVPKYKVDDRVCYYIGQLLVTEQSCHVKSLQTLSRAAKSGHAWQY